MTFVLLEDIIRAHLPQLFRGQKILESSVIRIARDAELELDDEGGTTHLELVERELRRRRRSDAVRIEMETSASADLEATLSSRLELEPEDVYRVAGPLDLRVLMGLVEQPGFDTLRDPRLQPVDVLPDLDQTDMFALLDERDLLLHHPYESYDPVVALLAQAAEDPGVLAIKQTLYRTSVGSPIIASLQRAAECNKQVTALVELTARFDEERNIKWARALEEAGAHVIYGVRHYKIHGKVCLIVRRTPQGLRRYVHLGTGNYNERTARLYTDYGLMTSSPLVAEDASAIFSALTGYSEPPRLKRLVLAPTTLRERFLKLIRRERRRAAAGQPAEIVAKMNSLIDEEIIEALYAASAAGVRIALNVRGICALRPGVPDLSANIEVISVVDRFPRTRPGLLLPQRRRRRVVSFQRRLDDPQSRQAHRADVPDPDRGTQIADSGQPPRDVPGQRQGARVEGATASISGESRQLASRRSGSSNTCRTKRIGERHASARA